jgi:hypothetical protein
MNGAKTIMLPVHVPPRPFGASQMIRGDWPSVSVRLSFPPAKNPMYRPSGDQKGHAAPSVLATSCASRASNDLMNRCETPAVSDPMNATFSPSGETTG